MVSNNLPTWASNFATLRRIAASTSATGFSRWQGGDRLLSPQFNAMLPMMMPLVQAGILAGGPAALEALPEEMRLDGREDLLLFGRYFLELAALKREGATFNNARTELLALLERLEQLAHDWARSNVVDLEQRRVLVEECRVAAERLRGRAA